MNDLSITRQTQIIKALCEGNPIRSTARITDTAINTVVKLLREIGAASLDYQDKAMNNLTLNSNFVIAFRTLTPVLYPP